MNKLMICTLASTLLLAAGLPTDALAQHHRGHSRGGPPPRRPSVSRHYRAPPRPVVIHRRSSSGWSTAGHLLAGIAIGSVLQNTCQSAPSVRREVISYRTVYQPPAAVREVVVETPATVFRETIWVRNSNGSETPVELRRLGNGSYIGPKGEYYSSRPSNDQLRMLYGL